MRVRPQISLKVAASLDARIATRTGDARWLSSKPARTWGHQLRAEVDGILVGANTVLADDPALTVRHVRGEDPLRVVLDSSLRTPLDARLYRPPLHRGTLVATTDRSTPERRQQLQDQGVELLVLPADPEGRVGLPGLLEALAERGVEHLLLEGGGIVHGAFLQQRLVDTLWLVLTPWLLGLEGAPAFRIPGVDTLAGSLRFQPLHSTPLGPDLLIEARPIWEDSDPCSPD